MKQCSRTEDVGKYVWRLLCCSSVIVSVDLVDVACRNCIIGLFFIIFIFLIPAHNEALGRINMDVAL